jgi:N utilization substance protein A
MDNQFLNALDELEKEKGLDKDTLLAAIEAALITSYKKETNSSQNVRVVIDRLTGKFKVFAIKKVVDDVSNAQTEISLETARTFKADYEVGDFYESEVTPKDFGRIAVQTAKQVITQRLREAERGMIYNTYIDSQDDIVTGIIQRQDARNYYVELGKTDGVLPLTELLPQDQLKQGDRVKVYVTKVDNSPKGPQIHLSRSHPGLLKRLFELEVPEIFDGIVQIKSVAREAGFRSKIAVHSQQDEVDPVGSCVGPKGMRVQNIVTELRGEKIDIVRYSDDITVYVANALSPSKVVSVAVHEAEKMARVIVPDHQLSLAIGIKGQNARLAAKLTGWKIDIKSESQAQEEDDFS